MAGGPRGVALGRDGIIYVGLADRQAVQAIDPKSGAVVKEVVLDSADIAATKELVTMRTDPERTRLFIANGSDESVSILSLPDLSVVREITLEGEAIRDALPDPKGRYLYVLGRRVHVFDGAGEHELRAIDFSDPTAIAVTGSGGLLAVVGPQDFGTIKATAVALYETSTFNEVAREPLQTDQTIGSAMFAANDLALVAVSPTSLFEKAVITSRQPKTMTSGSAGRMRVNIDFGDLVNSDRICLPDGAGPQIATLGATANSVLFAEQRCSSSGAFAGSDRRITPVSLYGVNAYAIAFDREANTLAVTDKAGYLTIYKVPRAVVAR